MLDIISVFKGAVNPVPVGEASWQDALINFQSGKYQSAIEKVRLIKETQGEVAYREAKKKLPAVTFCANFSKNRDHKNVLSATGFIIPDLDHLENVDEVFNLLSQDEHVWFIFRSPSGSGLKCAIRAEDIKTDDDIKKLYAATENYFKSIYALKLDPSCKDIARLTFVSCDPKLFINPNPKYFDIQKWLPVVLEPKFFNPPDFGNNGWKTKFGVNRLEECCQKIKESSKGGQHPIRLQQARTVGGWIASGFIDESAALLCLENAVITSGAERVQEAMKTIYDGIAYGKKSPLYPNERAVSPKKDDIQYYCDPDEVFEPDYGSHIDIYDENEYLKNGSNGSNGSNGDKEESMEAKEAYGSNMEAGWKQEKVNPVQNSPHNLAGEIKEWVENSKGSFTVDMIDREFCLTTRVEKNNRSKVLLRACACGLIKKHKNIPGKYEIIDKSLNLVDTHNVSEDPFDIKLPLDLHRFCTIPKKGIIIFAGSGNAGKTALALLTAKLNLHSDYQKYYLASEMGGGEIVDRLRRFKDVPFSEWDNIKFAERSSDFASVVEAHNPDGLTIVDYLEEIEGEYNKITSQIRSIYDSIGDGVALINIQKRTDQDYGRGGQGTAEKCRLYASVDTICLDGNDPICAIKIIKIKRWVQKNLHYHELHFKIKGGAEIEIMSDWMQLKQGERERYVGIYGSKNPERKKEQMDEWMFTLKTKTGSLVGINENTFNNWQKTYSGLNLMEELESIANFSYRKPFLNDKGWIYQVTGMLSKKNDKAKAE